MVDSYGVYYAFRDRVTDDQLEALARFLDAECEALRPADGGVDEFRDELDDGAGSLRLNYEGTVFDLRTGETPELAAGLPLVTISIDERWILPTEDDGDDAAVERMNEFYSLLGRLYERLAESGPGPVYVFGLDFAEWDVATDPDHANRITRERILDDGVPGVYWFQILPPATVEALGEERVRSVPAYRLDRLSDGAVTLAGTQGVLVQIDDYRDAAAEHLGIPFEQ